MSHSPAASMLWTQSVQPPGAVTAASASVAGEQGLNRATSGIKTPPRAGDTGRARKIERVRAHLAVVGSNRRAFCPVQRHSGMLTQPHAAPPRAQNQVAASVSSIARQIVAGVTSAQQSSA